MSRKLTFERLQAIGEDPASLDGVLVTHEHCDHVCGLPMIVKKLNVPVFVSKITAGALDWPEGIVPQIRPFQAGTRFRIGDVNVTSFTIPHDAADPVGFTLEAEGVKIGFVTDLGYMPESLRFHLDCVDFLMLESNHDLDMLKVGPYPWSVKQRVMGRKGHLSNDMVSHFILDGMSGRTGTLVLGHLSEHNNHPEIVRLVASQALRRRATATKLVVAEPGVQSESFEY